LNLEDTAMLFQCVRSLRSVLLLGLLVVFAPLAMAQSTLGSYTIQPNAVTVAGISSGGYMATQLQVAYSKAISGTAVTAGGAYYCAQDYEALWGVACATGDGVPVSSLVSYTKQQAKAGTIDPVSNLANKPIYMFSGTLDTVDYQATMDDLYQYYQSFTSTSNITYNNDTPAEHSWVTPDAITACSYLSLPYMNNCGIDPEQTFLTLFYGQLNARNSGQLGGSLIEFNQNTFCPHSNCAAISMDRLGIRTAKLRARTILPTGSGLARMLAKPGNRRHHIRAERGHQRMGRYQQHHRALSADDRRGSPVQPLRLLGLVGIHQRQLRPQIRSADGGDHGGGESIGGWQGDVLR
jgi:predicted esterase